MRTHLKCTGDCPIRDRGICANLHDDDLKRLRESARMRFVHARRPIFMEGESIDGYSSVISGVVKVSKIFPTGEQQIVRLLYPGDFLGEPAHNSYTLTAEAATDVILCTYPRSAFEEMLAVCPALQKRILELTVDELDSYRNRMLQAGRRTSFYRVAACLLELAQRGSELNNCPRKNYARFALPLTRSEIGDYLGMTLETVSRQIGTLKRKNIIKLTGSRDVIVPDVERLSSIVNSGREDLRESSRATNPRTKRWSRSRAAPDNAIRVGE